MSASGPSGPLVLYKTLYAYFHAQCLREALTGETAGRRKLVLSLAADAIKITIPFVDSYFLISIKTIIF